jgi:UDP-glucose 4-epimerase
MSKIIIFGCGYIGTNLANYISTNSLNEVYILGIENEYNNYLNKNIKFVSKMIEEINLKDSDFLKDSIVIDATGSTDATSNSESSSTLFLQNCSNKIELIEKLSHFKIKKYIFLSSGGTVYKDAINKHKEDEPVEPKNIYALEKVIIENYLKINNFENNTCDYLILRLSNPYGGIISKNKRQGIIDVAIYKLKNDEKLELFGNINNVRDYIYIDNLVEYIYKISISEQKNEIFNIGSGEGYSLKEIFELIEKVFNKKLKIITKDLKTVNIKDNTLDISKINKIVKLSKKISVEEGIEKIKNRT